MDKFYTGMTFGEAIIYLRNEGFELRDGEFKRGNLPHKKASQILEKEF